MPIDALVFDAYGTVFDTNSVLREAEAAFPGHGEAIAQLWRLKQLEYTWLRSLMGRYEPFETVTADALAYALDTLGLGPAPDGLASAYDRLDPYPEADSALSALGGRTLAILSNGSPKGLETLLTGGGLRHHFAAVLSVDACRAYKPDPRAYTLIEPALRVPMERVLFVSSNGFDIAGAKSFGLRVARINRAGDAPADLATPAGLFRAMRTRPERLGYVADVMVSGLAELAGAV